METTSDGALCGWMSMREPKRRPATMYGVRPTIVPSTGAKTLVPGDAADVERGGRAAVELVPGRMAAAAAEDLVEHALQRALVPLVAERLQRDRVVRARVVADRRRLRLHDRHLQADEAVQRDDLRERLRLLARDDVADREGVDRARVAAECGQRKRHDEHDREKGEEREPAGSTRGAHLPTFDAPPPGGA